MQVLFSLLIQPLEYLLDTVVYTLNREYGIVSVVLIGLSIVVSTLTLPLYSRADALQAGERAKQKEMEGWVKHIRRTFSGDERSMMLARYYRAKAYKPAYALRGILPLLLQIPFFIAAYHYLSNCDLLAGQELGPIADLGERDRLIRFAGMEFNLLPILMTVVNLLSGALYLKESGLKDRLQSLALAMVFLLLLYNCPSGLVFYWLCNNIYSLVKNLYVKVIQNKKFFLTVLLLVPPLHFAFHRMVALEEAGWLEKHGLFFALLCLPLVLFFCGLLRGKGKRTETAGAGDGRIVAAELAALFLLYGLTIPLNVISATPEDFINRYQITSPLLYVGRCMLIYGGAILVWGGLFVRMADAGKYRSIASVLGVILAASCVDFLFFGKAYGSMNAEIRYDHPIAPAMPDKLLNLGILLVLAGIVLLIGKYRRRLLGHMAKAVCAVSLLCGVYWGVKVQKTVAEYRGMGEEKREETGTEFVLDRNGKNVIFIMLDRALAPYIPYIMNERPELEASFDGFCWYPDTLSFGWRTVFASGPAYGGYEYMPDRINDRSDASLMDKHDEALSLMPVLFGEKGYAVNTFDPPYAGYEVVSDLSIFEGLPNVRAANLSFEFLEGEEYEAASASLRDRNLAAYSLMRSCPLFLTETLYDEGNYLTYSAANKDLDIYFLDAYRELEHLPDLTEITEGGAPGMTMIYNIAPHEPCLLQMPDYEPVDVTDNLAWNMDKREAADGSILPLDSRFNRECYCVNMASMLALGRYFDWLREMGVYDNTRIIVVADHGYDQGQLKDMIFMDGELDVMKFNPLLLVKDFDARGFTVSDRFMTNADVPLLAMEGIIEDPVNPFTGKRLTDEDKKGELHVTASPDACPISLPRDGSTVYVNTSNAPWYAVHDSIFKEENWSIWKEEGESWR
ncbi:MAG: YidC/Oxa1 family membrane protein insertase [Lachnospiraceae bacterium]|nr:YidC/Oxa1 family membrane protein insertase [Lachnospiraceae bacterium]